eukprot:4048252-Pyramimonas_sp.AAC.1
MPTSPASDWYVVRIFPLGPRADVEPLGAPKPVTVLRPLGRLCSTKPALAAVNPPLSAVNPPLVAVNPPLAAVYPPLAA